MRLDKYYLELIDGILPRADLSLPYDDIIESLYSLEQYYTDRFYPYFAAEVAEISQEDLNSKRKLIYPNHNNIDWDEDIKLQLLYSDHIIANDPLLPVLDDHRRYVSVFQGDFSKQKESLLHNFKRQTDKIYSLRHFLEEGLISFAPIRRLNDNDVYREFHSNKPEFSELIKIILDTLDETAASLVRFILEKNEEESTKLLNEISVMPDVLRYIISCSIEYKEKASIILMKDSDLSSSFDKYVDVFYMDIMSQNDTIERSLIFSEMIDGTVWVPKGLTINKIKPTIIKLNNESKVYSFLNEIRIPDLSRLDLKYILEMRTHDNFEKFRRNVFIASKTVQSNVGEPGFSKHAQESFSEIFTPEFEKLEKSLNDDTGLGDIPRIVAASSMAFCSVALYDGNIGSATLAGFSALLGYDLFATNRERSVKSSPIYILHQLRK